MAQGPLALHVLISEISGCDFNWYGCRSICELTCDLAYDVGSSAAARINDKIFSELKLKRNDRVKTIGGGIQIQSRSVENLLL